MSCSFKLISWRKIRYRLQFDCSTDPAATMNDSSSAHPGAAARPPVQSCSVLSLSAFAIYPALTSPRSAHRKMSWRVLVPFRPCVRNLAPSAPILLLYSLKSSCASFALRGGILRKHAPLSPIGFNPRSMIRTVQFFVNACVRILTPSTSILCR